MTTIGFIGGGRITRIFLQGFQNAGIGLDGISVYDPDPVVLENLKRLFPAISVSADNLSQASGADTVILAVHPPVMMESLSLVKPFLKADSAVVSLAPKITLLKMGSVLENCRNLARMNPSASSYLNQGLNPVCYASGFDPGVKLAMQSLLGVLGGMPEVDESRIEAYAMISAMGPTYFWFQIQKLRELAVDFGMDPMEADGVMKRMMEGTVNTLFDSGLDFDEVTDLVPVKPIAAAEATIKGIYEEYLPSLFRKIKP